MQKRNTLKNFPILFWIGITTVSIWVISIRFTYKIDGNELYFYGFPSPWLRWSQVSSLQYEVNFLNYLKNLTLNGILLGGVVACILKIKKNLSNSELRVSRVLGSRMLILGVLFFYTRENHFNFDLEFPDSSWKLQSSTVHLGFDRPYHPQR